MESWTAPNAEHAPPKLGEPPIHRAARLGDHDEIRRLAAGGANLNEVFDVSLDPGAYPNPATPFMVASGSGDGANVETLRLLIELGADPKAIQGDNSAANFAASGLGWNYRPGGDADRLDFVLSGGAPLPRNPRDRSRMLADVAAEGDVARVRTLLAHGIPATPAFEAGEAKRDVERIMGSIPKEMDPFKNLPWYMRLTMRPAMKAARKMMSESLGDGPYSFLIPLHQAVAADSVECARLLVEAGADPHLKDSSSQTAINCAKSVEMIRYLESLGLEVEETAPSGWTPLVDAVTDGDLDRTKALIEAGADVNASHDRGYTVLMSAVGAMERSPEMIQLLVDSGADPLASSELGYSLFHAAIDVNGEANDMESVRSTLTAIKALGVDINAKNARGQTPLGRALIDGTGNEVQVLCELGADPNLMSAHSCSGDDCHAGLPLFLACEATLVHQAQKVTALLAAGANPLATKYGGTTPLAILVSARCHGGKGANKRYEQFFHEFYRDFLSNGPARRSMEQFVGDLLPSVQMFVSQFFSTLPQKTDFLGEDQGPDMDEAISELCVYEAWWRGTAPE